MENKSSYILLFLLSMLFSDSLLAQQVIESVNYSSGTYNFSYNTSIISPSSSTKPVSFSGTSQVKYEVSSGNEIQLLPGFSAEPSGTGYFLSEVLPYPFQILSPKSSDKWIPNISQYEIIWRTSLPAGTLVDTICIDHEGYIWKLKEATPNDGSEIVEITGNLGLARLMISRSDDHTVQSPKQTFEITAGIILTSFNVIGEPENAANSYLSDSKIYTEINQVVTWKNHPDVKELDHDLWIFYTNPQPPYQETVAATENDGIESVVLPVVFTARYTKIFMVSQSYQTYDIHSRYYYLTFLPPPVLTVANPASIQRYIFKSDLQV